MRPARLLLLLVALAISCLPTEAQTTAFYSDRTIQPVSVIGSPQPLQGPIPYAGVRVCSLPLTQQQPCLPLASITDINGNPISNNIGGAFGQLSADVTGRFTFGCSSGNNYQVQYSGASNTPQGNYPITCPGIGSSPTLALPLSLSQGGFTNTLTGSVTAPRTWTLQDTSDTFVFRGTSDALTNKTVDISLNALKAAINVAGHYPRNNGSQYVDASIAAGDLPAGTGCSANQFANGLNAGHALACSQPAFSNLSGTATTSQIGTGTPTAGKYVDGGTGAWTVIPSGGATEFTFSTGAFPVSWNIACTAGSTGHCAYTTFAKAHTLVRVTYDLTQAPLSCATNAVVGVRDVTTSTNLATVTVNQGTTGYVDSGALSVATTAGDELLVGVITAAATCTTVPNGHSIVALFQ